MLSFLFLSCALVLPLQQQWKWVTLGFGCLRIQFWPQCMTGRSMVISSFDTKFLSTENYSWKVTQFPGFRLKLNLLFKLSNPNSNFALTLGYLNPALNNLALKTCSQMPPPPPVSQNVLLLVVVCLCPLVSAMNLVPCTTSTRKFWTCVTEKFT